MTRCGLLRAVLRPLLFLFFFASLSSGQNTAVPADGNQNSSSVSGQPTMTVRTDVQHDVSPPLRDMIKMAQQPEAEPAEAEEPKRVPLQPGYKPDSEPDSALQRTTTALAPELAPTVLSNFDGIGQGVFGFSVQFAPPDTNGAVGLTQYVQWVNVSFAVFDKTTGNMLPGYPVAGNTLWQGFGGPCQTNNDGDPVVMYDKLNDRWIFGQFAVRSGTGFLTNTLQCIAVSTTSDATGSYNRYAFQYNNEFDDYPKMAVWPDAYYITFNMFTSPPTAFLGTDACAYDGNAMRNGQPATQICFQQAPSVGGVLPADVDGRTPPPPGSPNYMVEFDVNSLNLYKFHVDFATPGNSTFNSAINIPVSPFTPFLCNGGFSFNCVPQPYPFTLLDTLGDRLMYRLAYRNFGDHESLVVNHSVIADPVKQNSGVRWYEIQDPNGAVTVAQQSTFAPDSNFRWMGSIAMDQSGDIALGYSVSSSTLFPSIAFAGRTPFDPPSMLESEITIINGTGSQTCCLRNGSPLTRWGDYSAMQVDPVDDCTFWYTTEYLKADGIFNWNTRIANFKFPFCGQPDLTISSVHSGNFTQGDASDTYTLTVANIGVKETDGTTVTVTDTVPTGLTLNANAASGTGWICNNTTSSATCTRSDVLAGHSSYPPITLTVKVATTAPGIVTNSVTVSGGGDPDTANNSATDETTVIQLGPDPAITKSHSGTFDEGKTGTYTITVKNTGLSPTDGTAVMVSDTMPIGLTLNSVSGTGWDCSASTSSAVSCTRSDALASNSSYPAITLTVNVAGDAPAVITNTATVSGGGDTNPLNNTSSDKTNVILHPDLTITKSHTGDFNQGATQPYILTVSNVGGLKTSGAVTVSDTLPAGLSPSSVSGGGWFCNITSSTTITCTRADSLAPKQSYDQIRFFVAVGNDAPASVINTATVSGGGEINTSNDSASDPTTIDPSPDLTIAKSHTPDPFIVGQTGTYTLTVSNTGHVATSGTVSVTDFLPLGLTATADAGTGWSCGPTPTTAVSCSRSDSLAVGSSYPAITVTVSVNGGAPQITNQATVSGGGEFNTNNDTASDLTNVTGPILSITKTHVGNFNVGQTGIYTITVSNIGPVATIASPVNVNDHLPLGMTATDVTGTGWSCSGVGSGTANCSRSDVLASNSSYPPITLTASVDDASISSPATNTVNVSGGGDLTSRGASDPTFINFPDLTITKSHNGNFSVGQIGATYTITVSNVGTVATGGGTVIVTDVLPNPMTPTAATGTGWTCTILFSNEAICNRPAGVLAPGNSYPPITLTVNVGTATSPSSTNGVRVGGIGESNLANDTADDPTTITGFSISPTAGNVTITAGSSILLGFFASVGANVGTIAFTATGLPPNSKATFNPTSVTLSSAVNMTLDTSGNGHTAILVPPAGYKPLNVYLGCFLAALALCAIGARRRGKLRIFWLATSISVLGFVLLLIGCGGGGGTSAPPPPPAIVTPAGTYTVTVTATSSNASVAPVNIPLTVTVK